MADDKTSAADVQEQMKQIRDDIATLMKMLKSLAEDQAGSARETALAEANALYDQTRQAADKARAKAQSTADSIEDYIAAKPVQSAIVALIAGVFIGLASRR